MKVYAQLTQNSSLPPPAIFDCENWNVNQVNEWLKGVDDGITPYLRHFIALGINGAKLINVDSDTLKRMDINKETTRNKIIAAINLLLHYCYSIKYENLQKLALKTSASSNDLLCALAQATPVINNTSNVSKHMEVLNGVLRALADTYEAAIRIIFWLERNPFIGNKKFARLRNSFTSMVDEMIDCINNPNNPKFFSVPQVLVERAHSIRKICHEIIHMEDPCVLYTAFLERVTIRRPPASDWGLEIGRTCLGVNLITRVDYNSPAAFSDKFDVGDEVIEIDGTPVVGWKHSNLLRKLNAKFSLPPGQQFANLSAGGNVDLQLLLCKRPRENGLPQRPLKVQAMDNNNNGEQETKQLTKMAMDFKNKIGTDSSKKWQRRPHHPQSIKEENSSLANSDQHNVLRRARSSSFTVSTNSSSRRCSECSLPQTSRCISLLMPPIGKQQLFRRASVWNESPPATLRSPFEGFQSESNSWLLLLATWGNETCSNKNATRPAAERERHQKPPPLQGIFEGENGNIPVLIEEKICEEEIIGPDGIQFANIELVPESELTQLGCPPQTTPTGIIIETEWNAPIKEITGMQIHQNVMMNSNNTGNNNAFLDSGNNPMAIIIDSPLSNIHAKIARFFYGSDGGSPSPNTNNAAASSPFQQSDNVVAAMESTPQTQTQTTQKLSYQRQLTNSECRTPITPNSKFSLELPLSIAASTNKLGGGEESSSLCSVDSPSSYSTTVVKTIATKCRLAPLAEPDDIGDLSSVYVPDEKKKSTQTKDKTLIEQLFGIGAQNHPQPKQISIDGPLRRELLPVEQKRTGFRASFHRRQWTKCWALIREGLLYVYSNQTAKEVDILIQLNGCTISKKPAFKTTKKHIFILKSNNDEEGAKLHFSTFSADELDQWIRQIQLAICGCNEETLGTAIFIRQESMANHEEASAGQQSSSQLALNSTIS